MIGPNNQGQVSRIGLCGGSVAVRVDAVMTRKVVSCQADAVLLEVWLTMKERGLQRIPVLDDHGRPFGIVYARDALQLLLGEAEDEEALLRDYVTGVGYR
jgi:CBS domain-containing protein